MKDYKKQHDALLKHPPQIRKGKQFVISIWSPVVQDYIPMAEWLNTDSAEARKDLIEWHRQHKLTLRKLKELIDKQAKSDTRPIRLEDYD